MSDNKKEIMQNAYLVDGDRVLIVGNFFTLLDTNLNIVKQVHCSDS